MAKKDNKQDEQIAAEKKRRAHLKALGMPVPTESATIAVLDAKMLAKKEKGATGYYGPHGLEARSYTHDKAQVAKNAPAYAARLGAEEEVRGKFKRINAEKIARRNKESLGLPHGNPDPPSHTDIKATYLKDAETKYARTHEEAAASRSHDHDTIKRHKKEAAKKKGVDAANKYFGVGK